MQRFIFAQHLAQGTEKFVVAPLLRVFVLVSQLGVARIDVAQQLRGASSIAAKCGEEGQMLERNGDG